MFHINDSMNFQKTTYFINNSFNIENVFDFTKADSQISTANLTPTHRTLRLPTQPIIDTITMKSMETR